MTSPRALRLALAALALGFAGRALGTEIHYSPRENLEKIDVALIEAANDEIDMAAYVLSDRAIADALVAAQERGVMVRLVLDRSQLPHDALDRLTPLGASVRISPGGPIMHLKSYSVDGRRVRAGSANFSASGLKHQANELVILDDPEAVTRFEAAFTREWTRSSALTP